MKIPETLNVDFIDTQYQAWKVDPASVSRDWQFFFEGFEIARRRGPEGEVVCDEDHMLRQSRVDELIYRYRDVGHLLACLDPLVACPTDHPYLNLEAFDLTTEDLGGEYFARDLPGTGRAPLKEIIAILRQTYCHSIGVEYMHLQDPDERRWLQNEMEPVRNQPSLDPKERLQILYKLNQSALFEAFLNKKYMAVTRFSLEGGDAVIPLLDIVTRTAARNGCGEIILGMAHRGRLNVQTHILGKSYEDIFGEFESCYDPENLVGAGDVKYHNGFMADIKVDNDHAVRMFLVNNPSHLEAVDPVVEGIARARQELQAGSTGNGVGKAAKEATAQVMPVLIHGDAAFAGQGVVAEVLNMSQLEGYGTGGTLHIIINNQIGYTTLPEDARSTRYATDVAKMLMVPVFHVHGEDPEAVAHVARLAIDYRYRFGKDVVIDLICYRRYGHNEGDEPYFTQPQMYDRVRQRSPLNRLYADQLLAGGVVRQDDLDRMKREIEEALEVAYNEVHGSACPFPETGFYKAWADISGAYSHAGVETGVSGEKLQSLNEQLTTVPEQFALNPKLQLVLKRRRDAVENDSGIDWANAEALAFASLVTEGHPVRLSGQDCARGTFSQRHSVLVDMQAGTTYAPLNNLSADQAVFNVYNSHLSEMGVLGFEYGYSLVDPAALTLWEAQFGDFVNNAQSIIDLFLASGQAKWERLSGLVLLLPHGSEGMGPEHSSARLERFLQLCADDNMEVCNPTTPAQYFHLLRRQVKRGFRKPLVVMSPKSLLRHPLAVSTRSELSSGSFNAVLDDPEAPKNPTTLLMCNGKIYYDLLNRRRDLKKKGPAIIRLEQIYPFHDQQFKEIISRYGRIKKWVWVQEEPENMGAWNFVRPRLAHVIGKPVEYIGRPPASSPATGFPMIFRRDQEDILQRAMGSKL
jgi:2-oxoglutarate dehydrogenase E1 component